MPLKTLKNRIARSPFARNVAIVATGAAGAQAVTMAFAPLITRLYGPEAFGVMGAFLAIVAIVTPLAALSYPVSIVLPKKDLDALGIARLSLIVGICMAAATTIILVAFDEPILELLNLEVLGSYIFLIPAAMLFQAGTAVMQQWVIRKKLFKIKSTIAVANALIVNSAKTGLGLVNPIAATLVAVSVIGSLTHALMLLGSVRRVDRFFSLKKAQPTPLKQLALRYRDFPLYRTPQVVVNAASVALPVLILGATFGPASAGFYTLTKSVLGLPLQLIGKSVGDVFYPRINEAFLAGENLPKLIAKTTIVLGLIGFLPFTLIIIFGPQLFSFVFGQDWAKAGEYASWMALWLYAGFINRPAVAAIPVLGLEKTLLVYEVIGSSARVGALALGVLFFATDTAAIAFLAITGLFTQIIFIFLAFRAARAFSQNLD